MRSDKDWVTLGLLLGGFLIIVKGIFIRLGFGRAWYFSKDYPVLLPKSTNYAMITTGFSLMLLGVGILMPNEKYAQLILYYLVFPFAITSLLVIAFQPKWFKPKWIRWLEDKHGDIVEILILEGRKVPGGRAWKNWEKQISTQEGLEAWIAEVRRKHGLK